MPSRTAARGSAATALPYELRVVAKRHPVALYITSDCPPCDQARELLARRGVPHEQRSVRTSEDVDAFRTLGFDELSFPVLRVGTDRLAGFEAGAWYRALDAAGYPKNSQLPPRWQFSSAEPLAPRAGQQPGPTAKADGSDSASVPEATGHPDGAGTARSASTPTRAGAGARAGTAQSITTPARGVAVGSREARRTDAGSVRTSTLRF